ncbi:MAG: class I SAM-dependent methyltransferase [Anaerolineae bacterium]|nr:class I SAM-dependent methyltransferase [Anaerolineae bacterium]
MTRFPNWLYNEMIPPGVDYSNPAQVEIYDHNHRKFRNYQKGAEAIIECLGLGRDDAVVDMGAGTGAFALYAARHCRKVYAVDVSEAMLAYARQQATEMGLTNIEFCHGGFLTYEHRAELVEAMVSIGVLHHLPDFWKSVGLKRAADMLKPGGRLYLFDVVFPSSLLGNFGTCFDNWVQSMADKVGPEFGAEVETHIRDEYSTYDWIMEKFLRQAGLRIDSAEYADGFAATYICTKQTG